MAVRKYEIHRCPSEIFPRCYFPLDCDCGPEQGEEVTVYDARDVETLVKAARELDRALWDQIMGREVYLGEYRERLARALAHFEQSDTPAGGETNG